MVSELLFIGGNIKYFTTSFFHWNL